MPRRKGSKTTGDSDATVMDPPAETIPAEQVTIAAPEPKREVVATASEIKIVGRYALMVDGKIQVLEVGPDGTVLTRSTIGDYQDDTGDLQFINSSALAAHRQGVQKLLAEVDRPVIRMIDLEAGEDEINPNEPPMPPVNPGAGLLKTGPVAKWYKENRPKEFALRWELHVDPTPENLDIVPILEKRMNEETGRVEQVQTGTKRAWRAGRTATWLEEDGSMMGTYKGLETSEGEGEDWDAPVI